MFVVLRRDSFPKLFQEGVSLALQNETVQGADEFLRVAGKYEDLALSIPWLNEYLAEHPTPIELRYVHGRSFSEKAMALFAFDMSALGRLDLANVVRPVQEQVALVVVGGQGYWLILPDKRMILWRFHNLTGSLKWNDLPAVDCSNYANVSVHCAGVLISAEGAVIR